MKDLALGAAIRLSRIRRRWRQEDLADRARVSRATVWRVEHGRLDELSLATIRRVAAALEIAIDLQARGRGADLERLTNARHSTLHETVVRTIARIAPDWVVASEVSFSEWGERGVIDVLLWHRGRHALVIIEFKTELVDVGDLLSTMDRRRRLAHQIVESRGWVPETVSTWVILAWSRTNERRLAEFRSTLRAAFPDDGRRVWGWLRHPIGEISALSLWRMDAAPDAAPMPPTQRVRACPRR